MRTTLDLDDGLVRLAQQFTGVADKTALTMPRLKNIPRRRALSH
jgi:Bacterial antitoxin of type II TA system, VapB